MSPSLLKTLRTLMSNLWNLLFYGKTPPRMEENAPPNPNKTASPTPQAFAFIAQHGRFLAEANDELLEKVARRITLDEFPRLVLKTELTQRPDREHRQAALAMALRRAHQDEKDEPREEAAGRNSPGRPLLRVLGAQQTLQHEERGDRLKYQQEALAMALHRIHMALEGNTHYVHFLETYLNDPEALNELQAFMDKYAPSHR